MRLRETSGDSRDSARLMETHENQGDYLGLIRLLILIKTKRDSLDSARLMRRTKNTVD